MIDHSVTNSVLWSVVWIEYNIHCYFSIYLCTGALLKALEMDSSNSEPEKTSTQAPEKSPQVIRSKPYLPPCRICCDVASGFHYGLNTCEACKGFFRRSVVRKSEYPDCRYNGNCEIEAHKKSACTACRYSKCLKMGMSKGAIRTGRYTVEMRTQYTLEIQGKGEGHSSAASTRTRSLSLPSETSFAEHNRRIVDDTTATTSGHSNAAVFPFPPSSAPAPEREDGLIQSLKTICDAFQDGFPETVYMFEHSDEIDGIVCKALRETNLAQPVNIMTISGDATINNQKESVNILTTKAEVLDALVMLNSSVSCELFAKLPEYQLTRKELFPTWCINIDKFVSDIMRFARRLPRFNSLPAEDQVQMIKQARPEAAALVGFKHFHTGAKVCVNYCATSRTTVLFSLTMLRKLFINKNYYRFDRMLRQINKLNIQMADLAVLCALTIFSPDRAGITDGGRRILSNLQDEMIPVLHYTLKRSHPMDKLSLAKFLMLLPNLHQINNFSSNVTVQMEMKSQACNLDTEVANQ